MKKHNLIGVIASFAGLFFGSIVNIASQSFLPVQARAVNLPIGNVIVTQPVNHSTQVYISKEMVPFVEATGATVITTSYIELVLGFIPTIHYQYYYWANEFVDLVVEVRSVSNDIDSVIFMTKQLENYAYLYINANNIQDWDVTNLVLGYIRNITTRYNDPTDLFNEPMGLAFQFVCGDFDEGFIDYVNLKESGKYTSTEDSLIDIKSYFACFVSQADQINTERYGDILDKYKAKMNMDDPVSDGQIDLIHMFCVLDALEDYGNEDINYSGRIGYLLDNLVSYIGDLQTATYERNNSGAITNFEQDILRSRTLFSFSDFFADLDGYNIGQGYLTNHLENGKRWNSVSQSIAAYYEGCRNSSFFRYQSFIKNVSYLFVGSPLDAGEPGAFFISENLMTTGLNAFAFVSAESCYINPVNLSDMYYYVTNPIFDYFLTNPYQDDGTSGMPSYAVRKSMVKGFINYVTSLAGYGDFYV